jgi:hypothetical protein
MSYREDVFHLPHTKQIIMSDLEVFEVRDGGKSGLVIGVAENVVRQWWHTSFLKDNFKKSVTNDGIPTLKH